MQLKNYTRTLITRSNCLFFNDSDGVVLNPETYVHNWTSTNSTIKVVSEKYVHPLQYSLKIQPIDPNAPIVLSLYNILPSTNSINNSDAQFHCNIYAERPIAVAVELTNVVQAISDSHQQLVNPGAWTGVFSPTIGVSIANPTATPINFSVDVTFTNHGGEVFFLSVPVLMNDHAFQNNNFVSNMNKFIPSFIWDKDKIQEYPNYPFSKMLMSMTRMADLSTQLYGRFYSYMNADISVANSNSAFRFSQLIDPEHVDEDYVDWLTQLNGTQVYKSITSSAATETIANVNASVTWQLVNAYFGRNAGTLEAIKECAQQVLSGNKVVYVFPGGSFFQINVYTLISETPGVSSPGDTSPEVMAILEKTRPMGFVLTHEAFNTLPFVLDDPEYGQLGGPGAPSAPGLG